MNQKLIGIVMLFITAGLLLLIGAGGLAADRSSIAPKAAAKKGLAGKQTDPRMFNSNRGVPAGAARKAAPPPLTPKLAAKRAMVRNQQEQRITSDKRRAAAEALKAERLKIYNARQEIHP